MNSKIMHAYDHIVIGAGVSGCNTAFALHKHSKNILLIDEALDVSQGASKAAGAFLSPLLGKDNKFKDLVNNALVYSTKFYKENTPDSIENCGTIRIPKDEEDEKKFQSYIPYTEFEYEKKEQGYFFGIGSVLNSYDVCKKLSENIEKKLNYKVSKIEYIDNFWILNDEIKTKNLVLSTGSCINLIDEFYLNIRSVWGQRIDVETSTCITVNYHKACSISKTTKKAKNTYVSSIGATHHRFVNNKKIVKSDTDNLIKNALDILDLKDLRVVNEYAGARASSVDYFPIVGPIINANKTIEEFPYLKKGTNVERSRLTRYSNLYMLNGLGGRGFVLAPYLANELALHICSDKELNSDITVDRLFRREVKRLK